MEKNIETRKIYCRIWGQTCSSGVSKLKENTSYAVHLTHLLSLLRFSSSHDQTNGTSAELFQAKSNRRKTHITLLFAIFSSILPRQQRVETSYFIYSRDNRGRALERTLELSDDFASPCKGSPLLNLVRTQTFWCRGSYSVSTVAAAVVAAAALISLNETTQRK